MIIGLMMRFLKIGTNFIPIHFPKQIMSTATLQTMKQPSRKVTWYFLFLFIFLSVGNEVDVKEFLFVLSIRLTKAMHVRFSLVIPLFSMQ